MAEEYFKKIPATTSPLTGRYYYTDLGYIMYKDQASGLFPGIWFDEDAGHCVFPLPTWYLSLDEEISDLVKELSYCLSQYETIAIATETLSAPNSPRSQLLLRTQRILEIVKEREKEVQP